MNNHILYRHIRLDKNEVFYVGIANNTTRPYSKHSRNRYWYNVVSKTDYKVDIVFDDLTRDEVEQKEMEFISLYGRKDLGIGTLVNMTDGGTGGLGLKHSFETKQKMKGRIAHNKGKSKWSQLEPSIIFDLKNGFTESEIKRKYGCGNGIIYMIKNKYK